MSTQESSQARLTQHESAGRTWTIAAYSAITEALTTALHEEQTIRAKLLQQYGPSLDMKAARGFDIGDDIFSNPFCDRLRNVPKEIQAGSALREGVKVEMIDPLTGRPEQHYPGYHRKHWYFRVGTEVVDPTAGQYVNLDQAIQEHPELFVGRILVATPEDAREKLGINYSFEF